MMHSFKSVTFDPQANYCAHKHVPDRLGWILTRRQPTKKTSDAATSRFLWSLQPVSNNSPYIILEINASAFLKGTHETNRNLLFQNLATRAAGNGGLLFYVLNAVRINVPCLLSYLRSACSESESQSTLPGLIRVKFNATFRLVTDL